MRRFLFGALLMLIIVLLFNWYSDTKSERTQIIENSAIIQEQIKNVGKLVVTEGNFSQVFTYKNNKRIFAIVDAEKKALVIVNAKVSIAYDLSKVTTEVDADTKTVIIKHIPNEEISINPDIEYYDVTQDYLNQFDADDYNKVKAKVNALIREKIEKSTLPSNAKNRLVSELQKIYILTNSMGWTLRYNDETIKNANQLNNIPFKD
ncbi:DUF4230 domain-containing protein [Zhouia sp. PK063]|uniref:DUF4230 domain-containing protein n=1 Tax=Zhouia sp. PK063 TaxID=3373602 RepID=UPI0037AC6444